MANDRVPPPENDDPVEAIKISLKSAIASLKNIVRREDTELASELEEIETARPANTGQQNQGRRDQRQQNTPNTNDTN